jgi:hypothetical protein
MKAKEQGIMAKQTHSEDRLNVTLRGELVNYIRQHHDDATYRRSMPNFAAWLVFKGIQAIDPGGATTPPLNRGRGRPRLAPGVKAAVKQARKAANGRASMDGMVGTDALGRKTR